MNILLISPSMENMLLSPVTSVVTESEGAHPPLGLMYIAAYLKKYSEHKIHILDACSDKISYQELETKIRNFHPDVVGIYTTSFTMKDAFLIARLTKKIDKHITIVAGGPHIKIFPEETASLAYIDFAVTGEGEITLFELLQKINGNKKFDEVKGLAFKENGTIKRTCPRPMIENLDTLPFPDRTMLSYKKYHSLLGKGAFLTSMITSRGCPFQCIFCCNLSHKYRYRSAKNIVDEMEACTQLRIFEFYIFDEIFVVNRKRTIQISDEILNRELKIKWGFRGRVDMIDIEILKRMKEAGCERINFGVQTSTEQMLTKIKTGYTLEQAVETFKKCKEVGITTLAYFMLGFPEETKEHILHTIKFAEELEPDYVIFAVTVPFPGSELYEYGIKTGLYKEDYWREFAKNPEPNFMPRVWDDKMSKEELYELLKYAYKKFYLNPKYIIKRLLSARTFIELYRMIKAGLNLLIAR